MDLGLREGPELTAEETKPRGNETLAAGEGATSWGQGHCPMLSYPPCFAPDVGGAPAILQAF